MPRDRAAGSRHRDAESTLGSMNAGAARVRRHTPPRDPMSGEQDRVVATKGNFVVACATLGAGYGAAYGVLATGFTAGDLLFGALGGALLGSMGGGSIGVVGLLIGSRLGWRCAAILGGVILGGVAPGLA